MTIKKKTAVDQFHVNKLPVKTLVLPDPNNTVEMIHGYDFTICNTRLRFLTIYSLLFYTFTIHQ